MTPLQEAERAVVTARAQVEKLEGEKAQYSSDLLEAEQLEGQLRAARAKLDELTGVRSKIKAAQDYLSDIERESAEAKNVLATAERSLDRERVLSAMEDAAKDAEGLYPTFGAVLEDLAEVMKVPLAKAFEIFGKLEDLSARYNALGRQIVPGYDYSSGGSWKWADGSPERQDLEAELEARGVSLTAVIDPMTKPQTGTLEQAWGVFRSAKLSRDRNAETQAKQLQDAARSKVRQPTDDDGVAQIFIAARYGDAAHYALTDAGVVPMGSESAVYQANGETEQTEALAIAVPQRDMEKARARITAALPNHAVVHVVPDPYAYKN